MAGGRRRRGFRDAIRATGARLVPIGPSIALKAAEVAILSARKDPGDGFLIAPAHVRSVPIVTRDAEMIALSREQPDYLGVVEC